MNREIKFRVRRLDAKYIIAYDFISDGKWYHKLSNNLNGTPWDEAPTYDGVFDPSYYNATYPIQREQFTGYLDKNFKEIYENDILTIKTKERRKIITYNTNVIYDKFFTVKINRTKFNDWGVLILKSSLEVVGNIIETPDLLNL